MDSKRFRAFRSYETSEILLQGSFKRKDFLDKNKETIWYIIVQIRFSSLTQALASRDSSRKPLDAHISGHGGWYFLAARHSAAGREISWFNWNGKVLMLVRKALLADSSQIESAPLNTSLLHNPLPCLVLDDEETRIVLMRNYALLFKAVIHFFCVDMLFPQGTMIAHRCRVIFHIKAGWSFPSACLVDKILERRQDSGHVVKFCASMICRQR